MADQWTVINRMLSRDEALKLWSNSISISWCKAFHPQLSGSDRWICCTRDKCHEGPHIDYHSGTVGYNRYLVWGNEEDGSTSTEIIVENAK